MKPLVLKIKGLNSFQEEQTIDFKSLTSVGLFGIFGATGSGKSTVIDAITMALYGEMARYPKAQGRQFINSQTGQMYVYLEFSLKNKIYVAERSYKYEKNGKDIKNVFARLYKKDGDDIQVLADKEKTATKEAIALIGLTYDDFSRAVILPQGKFSDFLLLENVNRRNMLERLFNLERYGETLNRCIKAEALENQNKILYYSNLLASSGHITKDLLNDKINLLKSDTHSLLEAKALLTGQTEKRNRMAEYFRLADELDSLTVKQKTLFNRAEKDEQNKKKLLAAQNAERIIPLFNKREVLRQQTADVKSGYENAVNVSKELAAAEEKSKECYRLALTEKQEQYPVISKKIYELEDALVLNSQLDLLNDERQKLLRLYEIYKTKQTEKEQVVTRLEAEKIRLTKRLDQVAAEKSNASVTPEYRQTVQNILIVWQDFSRSEKISSSLTAQKKELERRINEQKSILEENTRLMEALECQLPKVKHDLDDVSSKLTNLALQSAAAPLAKALEAGVPCPVCGSTNHPSPAKTPWASNISELEVNKSSLTEKLEQITKELSEVALKKVSCEERLNSFGEQLTFAEKELFDVTKEFEAAKLKINKISAELSLNQLNEDTINKLQKDVNEKDVAIQRLTAEEQQLKTSFQAIEAGITAENLELEQLKTTIQDITVMGQEKKAAITELDKQISQKTEGKPLTDYLQIMRQALNRLDENASRLEAELIAIQSKRDESRQLTSRLQAQSEGLNASLLEAEQELNSLSLELGYLKPEDAFCDVLSSSQKALIQAETNKYAEDVTETAVAVSRLKEQLSAYNDIQNADKSQIEALIKEIERLGAVIEEKTKSTAILEKEIEEITQKLDEAKILTIELKKYERQSGLFDELIKLMKGNRFVEFISERHLSYIIKEASERLREMTSGRYTIALDDTDFMISDGMDGGRFRSPKTLSGGEVFMTSLCLALSLSSKIQLKNNAPLEFFFLDEGFGALDTVRLDTVISCLEGLRKSNLTVGVISHIDMLKERIPIKLIVSAAAENEGGSTVYIETN